MIIDFEYLILQP